LHDQSDNQPNNKPSAPGFWRIAACTRSIDLPMQPGFPAKCFCHNDKASTTCAPYGNVQREMNHSLAILSF
jgi:hypothetical protein